MGKVPRNRTGSSAQWPAISTFSINTLSARMTSLQRSLGIVIVGQAGKDLHKINGQALIGMLKLDAPQDRAADFPQKVFILLGKLKETCDRIGRKKTKKDTKIPLQDLRMLQGDKRWSNYLGPMLDILTLSHRLNSEWSIVFETELRDESGGKIALHEVAGRKSLLPLLEYLEGLAANLSMRSGNQIPVEDIKLALELWADGESASFFGQSINFTQMVYDLVK